MTDVAVTRARPRRTPVCVVPPLACWYGRCPVHQGENGTSLPSCGRDLRRAPEECCASGSANAA
eukprot:533991-Prymnesium_polylepis.1